MISIFDIFSIGIGPSSSHTVGPMKAAKAFADKIQELGKLAAVEQVKVELYGALALTGLGHGTHKAILNGLEGKDPETVDPDSMEPRVKEIEALKSLKLADTKTIHFDLAHDLVFKMQEILPLHTNGMHMLAYAKDGHLLASQVYYSIGGGFIVTEEEYGKEKAANLNVPYPFKTGAELLEQCRKSGLSIPKLMLENEKSWRGEKEIIAGILKITKIMRSCIDKGCNTTGILPGGLNVKRRAAQILKDLRDKKTHSILEQGDIMNWLNVYALAVNEENAAGGRIVTAPTNGAAGIIPAVLNYYINFHENANEQGIIDFMLTATAIGSLCKMNASISGAEVGCQGEVGSACSMAAAGLTAALGGSAEQIENAAEIAMEHHLGMTCDPINGLVQVPCIERNAMGSVKAVNAARLALMGSGEHMVSLDKAIATMYQTGKDMMTIYKETSLGGLAVNIPEC